MSKIITDKAKIDQVLSRGVETIYPDVQALEKLLLSGKKIRLYHGIDPTGPTLHLGHMVQMMKLKQFQDLGHEIIFLIGDFTAQIGDPTDKQATRKQLTHQEVLSNCQGYKKQIARILDLKKVKIKFNSEWLNKLSFKDAIELATHFTAQQIFARDMFKRRVAEGKDLHLHEFFYPLMQAYDSVAMDVDLETGGSDQMFNMMAGRDLMKKMKNKEKFVLTTKLLEDSHGKKMGKTDNNAVALNDSPADMFGKIMSWIDGLIIVGFELLTEVPISEIQVMAKEIKEDKANPRDLKIKLAYEVVSVYWGEEEAVEAQSAFERVFQQGNKPQDIKEVKIPAGKLSQGKIGILDLFVLAGVAQSNSEVRRLIKEGAIKIDDKKVIHDNIELEVPVGGLLLQRGKRVFVKVVRK